MNNPVDGGINLPADDDGSFSLFTYMAGRLGCDENALKLIFSLYLGYPLCIIYNSFFVKQPVLLKHLYYIICGLSIGYFNYGVNIIHSLVIVVFTYVTLAIFGGKRIAVAINFIFCMSYLLWGYYMTQIDDYTFEWTIPQCVLTLRLIGVTFDVYDGYKLLTKAKKTDAKPDELVKIDDALDRPPSLVELMSHSYFPAGFFVGPQFAHKKYIDYVKKTDNLASVCFIPAIKRLLLGSLYLAIFQVGSLWWPSQYLLSPDFKALDSFFLKFTVVAIISKVSLCKYMSTWLISEGCCISSGLTYDEKSNTFNSLSNVNAFEFELTPTFGGIIRSFNIMTNNWAAKYIFKRLKFLGSKVLSHIMTLFFLALWHGWHTGYYVTFLLEFLIMKVEWALGNRLKSIRERNPTLDNIMSTSYIRWPLLLSLRIYTMYMFGYCLIPFTLLSFEKWYPVLSQLYFTGHLVYAALFVVTTLV